MTTSRSPRYCLQCDDGTRLTHRKLDMTVAIGALSEVVPAVAGWHCPVCAECEFDRGEGERFALALARVRVRFTEERAAAVRSTRKKLGLNQAQAGQLFGGGATAFSEYERGKTQPHKSTLLLLKLLDRHPDLLEELAG